MGAINNDAHSGDNKLQPAGNNAHSDGNNARSDDAGGGLRGGRPVYSEGLRELLNDEYGIDKYAAYTDIGGSSCLNLLVAGGGGRYLARVYRRCTTPGRLDAIQAVKGVLKKNGVPCAPALKTASRRNWTVWNGNLLEVEPYIAHDGVMDTADRIKRAMPTMGKMTSVLGGFGNIGDDGRTPPFANHVPIERALEMTKRGCGRLLSRRPTEFEREFADKSMSLAKKVTESGIPAFGALPKQLAHGDFWDNNILFSGAGVALIADFDFMGERRRVEDIALTLYFYAYFISHTISGSPESVANEIKTPESVVYKIKNAGFRGE